MIFAWLSAAHAFPWMIEHRYTGCAQCHVDPVGGGMLTDYGRAQGEVLVRMSSKGEPGKAADFAWGAVTLPDPLTLQADVRQLVVPQPGNLRTVLMQADLQAAIEGGPWQAVASVGVVSEGAFGARVIAAADPQGPLPLVSREHYVALQPSNAVWVRAGRMALPFGLRTDQHLRFTRAVTGTTRNDDQATGVMLSHGSRHTRVDVMAIVGQTNVQPAAFWAPGASARVGYAPENWLEVGLSGLITHSARDTAELEPLTRGAWTSHARISPVERLGFFAEAGPTLAGDAVGWVADARVDVEPTQGLHLGGGAEGCRSTEGGQPIARAAAQAQLFFAPHVTLRVDGLNGPLTCAPSAPSFPMAAAQLHLYL